VLFRGKLLKVGREKKEETVKKSGEKTKKIKWKLTMKG
jgi:hypothetical protein